MDNKFGDFPEISDTDSSQSETDSRKKLKKLKKLKKNTDLDKIFKSLAKALKKHNKLLQKEQQQRDAEQQQQEDCSNKNNCKNAKSFLAKLGDAFCKAVPTILTALATAVIGCLFNRKPIIKNFQTV